MIIIPDVHGRSFWEKAVDQKQENEIVLFLGDYVDPYTNNEGITAEQSFENFKKIIEYIQEHQNDAFALLGNHDFGYINGRVNSCRRSAALGEAIGNLIKDNIELFQFSFYKEINEINYLFSHAGIHKEWIDLWYLDNQELNEQSLKEVLEQCEIDFDEDLFEFSKKLMDVSIYRGGRQSWGSPVWADVREFNKLPPIVDNVYQVFGHSQQVKELIYPSFACLDCRDAFRLDDGGIFTKITNEDYLKKSL